MTDYRYLGWKINEIAQETDKDIITLSMDEIEKSIPYFELPQSARDHQSWWANTDQKIQALNGWLMHGWRVKKVNLQTHEVTFERILDIEFYLHIYNERSNEKDLFREKVKVDVEKKWNKSFYRDVTVIPNIPYKFDLASEDKKYVGIINFIPKAKSNAAEHQQNLQIFRDILFLLRTEVKHQFYVVGGNTTLFEKWRDKYGALLGEIKVYPFQEEEDSLEEEEFIS